MRAIALLLSACLCLIRSSAQIQAQVNTGKVDSLYSATLKQQRRLLIYLPPGYSPQKRYPVCYLLDGESHFHMFTGIVHHLANYAIPEMIVVGIVNINRGKDYPPTHDTSFADPANGQGEAFTVFIAQELIPYIDQHYSTAPYRVLAGHSLGGLLVINTLLRHAGLFKAYVALDPALWWDRMKLVSRVPAMLTGGLWTNNSLFLGLSAKYPSGDQAAHEVMRDTAARTLDVRSVLLFREQLRQHAGNTGLRWTVKYYPDEIHGSVPLPGYYDGLRFVFDFYKRPPIDVLTDTTVDGLVRHYERVSQKMGYTILPPEADLGGLAWQSAVLDHNPDRAYRYLQTYVRLYPKSAYAYESMGDYFTAKGDTVQARRYYSEAKALANAPK